MQSIKSKDAGKNRVSSAKSEANKVAHVGREEADDIESSFEGFDAEPTRRRVNACRWAQGVSGRVLKTMLDAQAGVGSRLGGKKINSALLERTEKILYSIIVVLAARKSRSDKPVFTNDAFPSILKSLVQMTESIYLASETGEEGKFVKYHLNCLLNRVLDDPELPPRPSVVDRVAPRLFTGALRVLVSRRVAQKDLSFVVSLQKGTGKAWPGASDKDVIAAYVKQMVCLTLPPAEPTELYHSTLLQCVDRLFVGDNWTGPQVTAGSFMNPTGRAAVGAPLAKGGTRKGINTFLVRPRDVETSLGYSETEWSAVQSAMRKIGATVPGQRASSNTGLGSLVETHLDFENHVQTGFVEEHRFATTALSTIEDHGILAGNRTEAVAIKEAGLKVRVITKMIPQVANAMRPPQEDLRKAWLRHGGNTMGSEDADLTPKVQTLVEIVKSASGRLGFLRESRGAVKFDSHDYESATEYVSPVPARTIMEYLADRVEGPRSSYYRVLSRTFEPRRVQYRIPDADWDFFKELVSKDLTLKEPDVVRFVKRYDSLEGPGRVVEITAVNGQPMGNPLSFTLLCLTNLAVFCHAVRLYSDETIPVDDELTWEERRLTRRFLLEPQRKVVPINGDDIVFAGTPGFSRLFRHVAESVGFRTAIGKSYRSDRACCINSQWFQNVGSSDPLTWTFQARGYLSQKLLGPPEMRKGSEGPLSPYEAAATLDAMVAKTPWTAAIIPGVFQMSEFKTLGRRLGYVPNWGVPRQLGGWGCYSARDTRITKIQRLVAASLAVNGGSVVTRRSEVYMRELFPGAFGHRLFVPEGAEKIVDDLEPSRWWNLHPGAVPSEEIVSDQWSDRLLMIYQWTPEARKERDMELICSKIKRDYRLSPMSDEAIFSWWRGFWVEVPGPPCPPLRRAVLPH